MKKPQIVIASLWVATVAGAFFIGKGTVSPGSSTGDSVADAKSSFGSPSSGSGFAGDGATGQSARSRLDASPLVRKGSSAIDAVVDITRSEDPIERANAMLALIDTLGPNDFEWVVAAFRDLGLTDERRAEYAMLLSAWAKTDPVAALTYADANTGGTFARNTILATWAATNPDGALAWAQEHHEGDDGNPWLVGVIKGLAPHDLNRATDIMGTMPRSRERGDAIRAIADMLAASDPDAARAWTQTIDDEFLRSGAVAFTAENIAEKDPSAAATWLAEINDVEAMNRVGENLTENWYRSDPDAAKTWATSLPAEAMGEAVEGIADQMVREDPVQAAEWISELAQSNPDVNFDGAVGEIIRGSSRSDPLLAAEWISGVRDERSRGRYYHWILGQWQNSDPAAANQWIQTNVNALPEHVRQRFTEQNQQNGG